MKYGSHHIGVDKVSFWHMYEYKKFTWQHGQAVEGLLTRLPQLKKKRLIIMINICFCIISYEFQYSIMFLTLETFPLFLCYGCVWFVRLFLDFKVSCLDSYTSCNFIIMEIQVTILNDLYLGWHINLWLKMEGVHWFYICFLCLKLVLH